MAIGGSTAICSSLDDAYEQTLARRVRIRRAHFVACRRRHSCVYQRDFHMFQSLFSFVTCQQRIQLFHCAFVLRWNIESVLKVDDRTNVYHHRSCPSDQFFTVRKSFLSSMRDDDWFLSFWFCFPACLRASLSLRLSLSLSLSLYPKAWISFIDACICIWMSSFPGLFAFIYEFLFVDLFLLLHKNSPLLLLLLLLLLQFFPSFSGLSICLFLLSLLEANTWWVSFPFLCV
jgi:hypothetical protein